MEKDMVERLLAMVEGWFEKKSEKTEKERYLSAFTCLVRMQQEAEKYLSCRKEERISLLLKVRHKATQFSSREEGEGSVQKLYGVTAKQEAGLYALCEQVNTTQLKGTGIVAAPFWMSKQIEDLKNQNLELTREAEEVISLVKRIQAGTKDGIGLPLQPRTSIFTGNNIPYIPGETGPRIGDEHLDTDHVYSCLPKKTPSR